MIGSDDPIGEARAEVAVVVLGFMLRMRRCPHEFDTSALLRCGRCGLTVMQMRMLRS